MGYDRGDSFPFDFEPNGIPFGSKLKGKLSPRSYPIRCERKWKYSFLSVTRCNYETKLQEKHYANYYTIVTSQSARLHKTGNMFVLTYYEMYSTRLPVLTQNVNIAIIFIYRRLF